MKESLYLTLIIVILSTSLAKLILRTTDKPLSKIVSGVCKTDVTARNQNGDSVNLFNIKQRNPRNSVVTQRPKNVTKSKPETTKVLVKKPIPKYHEVNSDEDYQMKVEWPQRQVSAEHEDEDFNINDYEFDVNHDEFVSGRKLLEPRTKFVDRPQSIKEHTKSEKVTKHKPGRSLVQKKTIFPRNVNIFDSRNAADKMKSDDYDKEFPTTTQASKNPKIDDEDESDETEDSRETSRAAVRIVRSPWHIGLGAYVDKIGEKTTKMISKFLSILPIFPVLQIPTARRLNEDLSMLDKPAKNPLRSR